MWPVVAGAWRVRDASRGGSLETIGGSRGFLIAHGKKTVHEWCTMLVWRVKQVSLLKLLGGVEEAIRLRDVGGIIPPP